MFALLSESAILDSFNSDGDTGPIYLWLKAYSFVVQDMVVNCCLHQKMYLASSIMPG